MYIGRTVFAQVMDFLPWHTFRKCVERYRGDHKIHHFACSDQFRCMAFAQLTYRESLRDTVTCLSALRSQLYHAGIRSPVSKSTLADANEHRDWRLYAEFASALIQHARALYHDDPFNLDLTEAAYALDATTIELCLALFPWARFKREHGAIKLHTLLDLKSHLPSFLNITDGKVIDVRILDVLVTEPGSVYVLDRGYIDFARLHTLAQSAAFFVIRSRDNLQFRRLYSHPIDKASGLRCDQTIALTGVHSATDYPVPLRRIRYVDPVREQPLTFLTNHFQLPALTVAQLYKARWQIELFFKWIKQHLRIKAFYGTSANAVKTQVWIAITVYVLVAIIKKRLRLQVSLYTLLQLLSVTLFEKVPLGQLVTQTALTDEPRSDYNQLMLFEL